MAPCATACGAPVTRRDRGGSPESGPVNSDRTRTPPHASGAVPAKTSTQPSIGPSTEREITRAHRPLMLLLALAAALLAAGCLFWPQQAWLPWPLPPLHTRCLGVLYAAAAYALTASSWQDDIAAMRVPLALAAAICGALAWATLRAAPVWPVSHALAALGLAALFLSDRTLKAPAEHADPRLVVLMLAAATLAVLLVAWPARRIGLQTLAGLALGLLVVSAMHRSLFAAAAPSTWAWVSGWLLVAALVVWRWLKR
jgi:hypothetical protein